MEIEYGKVVLTKEEYIALLHDARMLAYLSDNDALIDEQKERRIM